MAKETTQQPRNIFELINQNIVDMSKDVVSMYDKVNTIEHKINAIYNALYPNDSEPNASGAEETE